jgi:hypothetical protein
VDRGCFRLLCCWFPCTWALVGDGLTADEVLAQAVEALGGEERLTDVGTIEASGTIELLGMTGTYEYWAQAPNKFKEIFDLEIIHFERAVAAEEGWEKRDEDVRTLVGSDLESLKRRSLFQPLLPFSIVSERPGRTQTVKIDSYRVGAPQPAELYRSPLQIDIDAPFEVGLASIPRRVFKENDGVWAEGAYESWVVHVVVDEKHKRMVQPLSASAELYAGDALVKTVSFSAAALEAVQDVSFKGISVQPEVFDLRHYFSEAASLDLDRLIYRLRVKTPRGEEQEKTLEIALERYEQKTELVFPLKGKFVIAGGHAFNEDHRYERSQFYADDIIGLGPDYQVVRGDGESNEDYYTWGREILAPAAGTVVFAGNDVPDNSRPGVIEAERFLSLPDPLQAIAGNLVVLDHGNGEFSLLGHMMHGSVRVSTGDRVERRADAHTQARSLSRRAVTRVIGSGRR